MSSRSCAVCHRRKVRCDKEFPCSRCTRGGLPCSYPPAGPITRRRKTTINDVASRISGLERTLETIASGQVPPPLPTAAPPPPPPPRVPEPHNEAGEQKNQGHGLVFNEGTVSHYVNEVIFSSVIEQGTQEHDVRTALATPRSETTLSTIASPLNPMGFLSNPHSTASLASYHPSRPAAVKLWKTFVDNVDSCTKVVHIPTTEVVVYTVLQDPSKASAESLGLCFSIYYAASLALDLAEAESLLGEARNQSLPRFKAGLEHSLTAADFLENPTRTLLQALAIYLAAMRVHDSGRAGWIMNGLALRAAQSMGLHRDGSKLGLSPFESEIRRRLWWHFLERDGKGAEDHGLQNPSFSNQLFGVDQPRNLHDSDLSPEMTELPPSRPGWTRMTLPLVNIQATRVWGQLLQRGCSSDGTPDEDVRALIIQEATSQVQGTLQQCNTLVPEQRITALIGRLILRKLDIVTRRQCQSLRQPDDQASWATESNLCEAMEVLVYANDLWQDDDLRSYHWVSRAFPQYHLILYILRHLCVCPRGPNASRAFNVVESHITHIKAGEGGLLRGMKWTVLMTLRERALIMMQKAERDESEQAAETRSARENVGIGEQADYNRPGDEVSEMQPFGGGDQVLPDWNMLLQEFQMEVDDFSFTF
ncbi:hypothetical protein FZEAL_6239 [Fusarium zealandicum]|uniref:Zn(2)-C6 fungal-type domain-containing protein n=1 Tax=Fusarium zealandicum TaxID=1053134 RepID=A0A8H4XJT9_9HYPO|nr:hypothetical protein FZEAL_6239 [Fusarium zealandicum]